MSDIQSLLDATLTNYGLETIKDDLQEIKSSLEHAHGTGETAKFLAEDNQQNINALKLEVESMNEKLQAEHEEMLRLSVYSRRSNLKFYGIKEEEGKESELDCELKINVFLQSYLQFEGNIHVERCHRLGKKNSNAKYPRPIIVRFTFFKERQRVWKNKSLLSDKPKKKTNENPDQNHESPAPTPPPSQPKSNVIIKEDFPLEVEKRVNKLMPIFLAAKNRKDIYADLVADKLYLNGKLFTVNNLDSLPDDLKPENLALKVKDDTLLFWKGEAYLSNFHPSKFEEGATKYNCVEQYLCSKKALCCSDEVAHETIMKLEDPAQIKQTRIKNFKKDEWDKIKVHTMKKGLELKFSQNPNLRKKLLDTRDKVLAESSPTDSFWGTGISMNNRNAFDRTKWGRNVLGRLLMDIREELR